MKMKMKMKSTKTDMVVMSDMVDSIVDESMCLRTAGVSAVLLIIIDTLHDGGDDDQIIDRSPFTSYDYNYLSNKLSGYIDQTIVYDHCRSGSGDSSNNNNNNNNNYNNYNYNNNNNNNSNSNNYHNNNNYQGNNNMCQDECLEKGLLIRNHYNRTAAAAAAATVVTISIEKKSKSTEKEIKVNSYTMKVEGG
jgi:hypothetical protein